VSPLFVIVDQEEEALTDMEHLPALTGKKSQ